VTLACLPLAVCQSRQVDYSVFGGKLDSAYAAKKSGNYRESARLFSEAIALGSTYRQVYYMAASTFALCGEADSAVRYVDILLDLRWRELKKLQRDSAFNLVRNNPEWKVREDRLKYRLEKLADIDSMLDHMDRIAATAFQYRIRPKALGGGNYDYTGYELSASLVRTPGASFACLSVSRDTVIVVARPHTGLGEIVGAVDEEGAMTVKEYTRQIKARIEEYKKNR
jgi:hypothetical protein